MNWIRTPLQKGALLGGGLAFGTFGMVFIGTYISELLNGDGAEVSPWSVLYVLVPVATGVLTGGFWGHMAGRVVEQTNPGRYLKVCGYGLLAYLIGALLVGTALVVGTAIEEGQANPDGSLIGDSIKISLVGALILGPLFVPVVAVLTFILERWTRI